MVDPLGGAGLGPVSPVSPLNRQAPGAQPGGEPAPSFRDVLMDSLNEVNRLQQEAAAGVEKVVTGESDNIAEVFSAVRKADVAFSMLMEMRNKLVEAYREVQQMRV